MWKKLRTRDGRYMQCAGVGGADAGGSVVVVVCGAG